MSVLQLAQTLKSSRGLARLQNGASAAVVGGRRSAHDLVIERRAAPGNQSPIYPIIKKGPPTGGRSAQSGHIVTVLGATGFLGRYLVAKLAKAGTQVVVGYREEDDKRHLKVMGDLGQIVPLELDVRRPEQIAECVRHSDTVYNLIGRDWETRNYKYEDVNVETAATIAKIASDLGVPRMVHLSHLNADPNSSSKFYRTKYEGEVAVREAYPDATIVRPGPLFGGEDWLLNAIANYPVLFHLNGGKTKTRPAHVLDVAQALTVMLDAPKTSIGSTFALPGPATYTYADLVNIVSTLTLKSHAAPAVPKPIAMATATVLNRAVWWPTISPDEIERKYIDDKLTEVAQSRGNAPAGWESASAAGLESMTGVDGAPVKSWHDLDIEPELLEEHAIKYVRRYRSAATYDAPVEMGTLKPKKAYHIVP